MQVTDLKIELNMKEELLEAIYGTVERLEQKVGTFCFTKVRRSGNSSCK